MRQSIPRARIVYLQASRQIYSSGNIDTPIYLLAKRAVYTFEYFELETKIEK